MTRYYIFFLNLTFFTMCKSHIEKEKIYLYKKKQNGKETRLFLKKRKNLIFNPKIYTKNKLLWSKKFIEKRIFSKIYKISRKISYTKSAFGISNFIINKSKKIIKKNLKIALYKMREFNNGSYILRKNIDWIKIKKLIDQNQCLLNDLKGFINEFFSDWPIIKNINTKIKILIDNYINFFIIKKNKYPLKREKFIEQNVKEYVLFFLYNTNKEMPKLIYGKRFFLKKVKNQVDITLKYLNIFDWERANKSIHDALNTLKKFLKTRSFTTDVFYPVTWDAILERIETAKNIINEYHSIIKKNNKLNL